MARNTFEASIEGIKSVWGPLSTEVVAGCRRHLEDLIKSLATDGVVGGGCTGKLRQTKSFTGTRHRGSCSWRTLNMQGCIDYPMTTLGGWVIYALPQGEIEMGTYIRREPGRQREAREKGFNARTPRTGPCVSAQQRYS
jgi:hypothetical protein